MFSSIKKKLSVSWEVDRVHPVQKGSRLRLNDPVISFSWRKVTLPMESMLILV